MKHVFSTKSSIFALIAGGIAFYNVSFFGAFLAVQVESVYGVADDNMGYVFMALSGPYFFSAILIPAIFGKTPPKVQFVICFFLSSIGMALMGPSKLFGLPQDKLYIVLIGMIILGGSQALVFIPSIPEAIEAIQMKYKIIEGYNPKFDNQLNDIVAGVTNQLCSLFALIGPIIGGIMNDNLGYQKTMNINMYTLFGLSIFFAIFNCGFTVFSKEEKRKHLKERMDSLVDNMVQNHD